MWDRGTKPFFDYEAQTYIAAMRAALEIVPLSWKPPFTTEQSCDIYAEYEFTRKQLHSSGQFARPKAEILAKLNDPSHADVSNPRCERYYAVQFTNGLIASVPAEYWQAADMGSDRSADHSTG